MVLAHTLRSLRYRQESSTARAPRIPVHMHSAVVQPATIYTTTAIVTIPIRYNSLPMHSHTHQHCYTLLRRLLHSLICLLAAPCNRCSRILASSCTGASTHTPSYSHTHILMHACIQLMQMAQVRSTPSHTHCMRVQFYHRVWRH
jgi:hypothetical protein